MLRVVRLGDVGGGAPALFGTGAGLGGGKAATGVPSALQLESAASALASSASRNAAFPLARSRRVRPAPLNRAWTDSASHSSSTFAGRASAPSTSARTRASTWAASSGDSKLHWTVTSAGSACAVRAQPNVSPLESAEANQSARPNVTAASLRQSQDAAKRVQVGFLCGQRLKIKNTP